VTEASYDAGTLELGKTYYWKINEVNEAETPTTWQGDVWHFAVADYLVVDDMESYGDANTPGEPGSRIWYTWRDGAGWSNPAPGWGGNGTGAMVDVGTAVVNTGNQSLKYDYDNDGTLGGSPAAYYSEATANIDDLTTIGRDWTKGGVKALSLWFYGDPGNAATATEQMYVKVGGAKVVYDGDMADIQEASWHEWNIDLADFAALGANLNNVTQISIGFGNENNTTAGGSGVVYFDDIRLYPARCVPERKAPPAADLTGDCVVDYLDIDLMAADWLIAAVAPDNAGLVAHWKFDADSTDSAGNHDGTILGGAGFVVDADRATVLSLDGVDGHVEVPHADDIGFITDTTLSISVWVKPAELPRTGWTTILAKNRDISPGDAYGIWISPTNEWQFRVGNTAGNANLPTAQPATEEWHHLVMTHDPSVTTLRGYLDGEMIYENTAAAPGAIGNTALWIGGAGGVSEYYPGLIDDLRIYNYVLSRAQVLYFVGLKADLHEDDKIDFKDYAVLADSWLDEQFWP
jgi:hypothetical protein